MWSLWRSLAIHNRILVPVLHRTNVVVHHSHGVPARQEPRHNLQEIPNLLPVINTGAAPVDSHDPYSRDGEGRKADRQDDPGGHWAGEGLPLSQAWGKHRGFRRETRQEAEGRGDGLGCGGHQHKGKHTGVDMRGETKRAMPQLVCSTGPATQQSKDLTEDQQPDLESVQHKCRTLMPQ